jgi:hypothetical protein
VILCGAQGVAAACVTSCFPSVTAGLNCSALTPKASALQNEVDIQWCLDNTRSATLGNGVYEIQGCDACTTGLLLRATAPTGTQLVGNSNYPTIKLLAPVTGTARPTAFVVVESNARVGFLDIQSNGNLAQGTSCQNGSGNSVTCSPTIVRVSGDDNYIDNNYIHDKHISKSTLQTWIPGSSGPRGVNDVIGVYIYSQGARDNGIVFNQIYDNHYGVIVHRAAALSPASDYPNNVIASNQIYNNRCDATTLIGYGVIKDNTFHNNGYWCANGVQGQAGIGNPGIPGAAIYSLNNDFGGYISGNTIYNQCGANIDLDRVSGFEVYDNSSYDPGAGLHPTSPTGALENFAPTGATGSLDRKLRCGGGAAFLAFDAYSMTIVGNTFENNDSTGRNMLGNADQYSRVYSQCAPTGCVGGTGNSCTSCTSGAAAMSDIAGGEKGVVAFIFGRRPLNNSRVPLSGVTLPTGPWTASGPTGVVLYGSLITDNDWRGYCGAGGGCTGLGAFFSRGTGWGAGGSSSLSAPNYMLRNTGYGSQVGSNRCGYNWWAGDSGSCSPVSGDCNDDDGKAPHTTYMYRNDGCWYN